MCRYIDVRRTISFQNRGKIHAHGDIGLEELKRYSYKKKDIGYVSREITDEKCKSYESKAVKLTQCSFVVAIPQEMSTFDEELFCGSKQQFRTEYASSEDELKVGEKYTGRPISPKYIVGYFFDGDISTFVGNSGFYGFKQRGEGQENLQLDLEKIKAANENAREKREEQKAKSTQELGKETIEEQKLTEQKGFFSKLIKSLTEKTIQKRNSKETR